MADEEEVEELFGQWEGPKTGNAPHGKGIATYPNEDKYEGEVVAPEGMAESMGAGNALRHGHGVYTYSKTGARYEGGWKDNRKDGKGTFKLKSGAIYEGNWKEGKRDGQGTLIYANGDWYKGEWKAGKREGKGAYYSKAGVCWYVGEWKDDEFVKGDWKMKDGGKYSGSFKDNKPSPQQEGVFVFADGKRQEGRWVLYGQELLWQSKV